MTNLRALQNSSGKKHTATSARAEKRGGSDVDELAEKQPGIGSLPLGWGYRGKIEAVYRKASEPTAALNAGLKRRDMVIQRLGISQRDHLPSRNRPPRTRIPK
jgi:hypothetical protein